MDIRAISGLNKLISIAARYATPWPLSENYYLLYELNMAMKQINTARPE